MAQAPALGEVVSNTSAKERQHKCEVLISEAMGIASVQNPFTDRNMPYEQPFQPDAGDAEAVPIFVILLIYVFFLLHELIPHLSSGNC